MADPTDESPPQTLTEPAAGAGPATKAVGSMRSGMDGIRLLFAELVPPTDIVLIDSLGNEYPVGATASAAAQITLMREMEATEWVGRDVKLVDAGGGVNRIEA